MKMTSKDELKIKIEILNLELKKLNAMQEYCDENQEDININIKDKIDTIAVRDGGFLAQSVSRLANKSGTPYVYLPKGFVEKDDVVIVYKIKKEQL